MNDEQIKLQKELEELEKRISKSSSGVSTEQVESIVEQQTGQLQQQVDNTNEQIATLSLSVEELEGEVNTVNEQVSTMSTNIEIAEKELENLEDEVQTAQTVINNTLEELSNFQNITNEKFNNYSSMFSNLSPVAYSGSYNDLTDIPVDVSLEKSVGLNTNKEYFWTIVNRSLQNPASPIEIFFICEPGQFVSGEAKLIFNHGYAAHYNVTCQMFLNDTEYLADSTAISYAHNLPSRSQMTIDFTFMPTKSYNKITFYYPVLNSSQIIQYDVVLNFKEGKNVMVLNDTNRNDVSVLDSRVLIGNTKYYDQIYYTIDEFSNEFDDPKDIVYTTTEDSNMIGFNRMYVWAKTPYGVATIGNSSNNYMKTYIFYDTGQTNNYAYTSNMFFSCISPTYSTRSDISCSRNFPYINLALIQPRTEFLYQPVYLKFSADSLNDLCFQSTPLPTQTFVQLQAVLPTYSEEFEQDVFYGYIAVRRDGQCFYFPDYDSNYYIKLGVGRRPMGYIRNGIITIILGGNDFCTRFVLKKNSAGLWVVVNRYAYKGIDNLRLINHDKYLIATKNHYIYFDLKEKYFPETENIDDITYSTLT